MPVLNKLPALVFNTLGSLYRSGVDDTKILQYLKNNKVKDPDKVLIEFKKSKSR